MDTKKTVNIEININDIRYNYLLCREITNQVELCIPMIKADAYGFNYYDVVHNLLSMKEPQRDFFVYSIEEGIDLRKEFGDKIRYIYSLTGPLECDADYFCKYNIIPVLNSKIQADIWSNCAKRNNKILDCMLQFNLGLNRSGIQQSELKYFKKYFENENNMLNLVLTMGHLACQYKIDSELGQKYTKREIELYQNALKYFPNIKTGLMATEGMLRLPQYLYDSSRPGTCLIAGGLEYEHKYIFRTCITITAIVKAVQNSRTEIYLDFGIKNGLCSAYKNKGYIYIDDEKIYSSKVLEDKIIFETKNNTNYIGKTALIVGYYNEKYINAYEFSKMNNSVPEEILCRVAEMSDLYPKYIETKIIGGYSKKITEKNNVVKMKNNVIYCDNQIVELTSKITEIRIIEEDGACGYDATELVKKGDIIVTFPMGYADGFYRQLNTTQVPLYIETKNGKIIEGNLCGKISMDQACLKINKTDYDKIEIGDKIILIDNSKMITSKRFSDITAVSEPEMFLLIQKSRRINIIKK